jgi:acetyl esterase/lipase
MLTLSLLKFSFAVALPGNSFPLNTMEKVPMRQRLAVAYIAALIIAHSSARAQDPEQIYKEAGARASKPAATIQYGPDPLQVADLRVPAGRGPYPVAIILHGGCFRASVDKRQSIAGFADALGKKGFATWNIEYRRVGDAGGGWPGTFQDVAAGVDKLAAIAPKYHLDMKRVTIVGHSAGAFFALWAASRAKLPAPWSATKIHPVSVVAIDGPGTLAPFVGIDAQVCGEPVIAPLMGGTPKQKPAEYKIASPQDHLPLGLHQLAVPADLGDLMQPYIKAVQQSSEAIDVLTPPNANHFDVVTPGTPNGDAVIEFVAAKALDPAHKGRR